MQILIDQAVRRFRRHRPTVICPAGPGLPLREGGFVRLPLPVPRRLRLHVYPLLALLALRALRPGVVHLHNRPRWVRLVRRALPEARLILHMHNLDDQLSRRKRAGGPLEEPYDVFVAVSEFLLRREAQRLAKGARRQVVIPNGVDLERFRPWWEQPSRRERLRDRWGLRGEVALFCGRLEKGLPVLREVAPRLRGTLLVVGGGKGGLEGAICLGELPPSRVQEAYLVADLLVHPVQWAEPFGLVLLEAQACGLPVVASPRGAIPEVLEGGVLVEPDPQAVLEATGRLLEDPSLREGLGRRGRRWAERFSLDRMVDRWEGLYG